MMKQLRANSERVNRSVARPVSAGNAQAGIALAGNALFSGTPLFGTDAATIAWTVKPVPAMASAATTAICTNGKYHARRLQEMHT
jgi:hypothetical protein